MSPLAERHRPRVAVLSGSWGEASESGAAVRSVAGGLSRHAQVDVLSAQPVNRRDTDGAFERIGIGTPRRGASWPDPARSADLRDGTPYGAALVDSGDAAALALVRARLPSAKVLVVGPNADAKGVTALDVGLHGREPRDADTLRGGSLPVGLYVRVHPDAGDRPHHELLGATGYVLVLSARDQRHATAALPADQVRWLLARFPRRRVVVVENGVATVWRSRAPVSRFGVHTRMDLWRLLAHALLTVDLCPGALFARECVESLRYGVPVVVPRGTVADALAVSGGGAGFTGTAGLLDAVEALGAPGARARAGSQGRAAVDHWYGDPDAFVSRVALAVRAVAVIG